MLQLTEVICHCPAIADAQFLCQSGRVYGHGTPGTVSRAGVSELYQGLGIALTGGLAFSTLLMLTVVPASMALLRDFDRRFDDR